MAKEVSQAGTMLGVNPSLMIVWTSDTTSDIAMAMITGTSSRAYLGSTRRAVTLDSSGWVRCMSLAPFGRRFRSRISVVLPPGQSIRQSRWGTDGSDSPAIAGGYNSPGGSGASQQKQMNSLRDHESN
jgi:hypothetical protein